MKFILGFIGLLLVFTACKKAPSEKSDKEDPRDYIENISDTMDFKAFEPSTIEDKELVPYSEIIELSKKVFDIKTDFSPNSCEPFIDGCDCCSGKIVFIDENIFIEEFYCIPNDIYYIGYYNILENKIKLYYEPNYVTYGPEDEMDFMGDNVYVYHQFKDNASTTIELSAYDCNGNLIIKSDEVFYSESETITSTNLLEHYSKDEFWKILNVTEIIENFYH